MARSSAFALAVALALALGCSFASAQAYYEGPESFISSFDKVGNVLSLPGANISLVTASQVYGINVAGMSAALINLAPCTIIEPHTHPHPEFAYTIYGSVTHSTPYNNLTLYNLTANTGEASERGFALFPANQLHVTYNPTCEPAQILSVFCTPYPNILYFPYAQSFFPSNVTNSYFTGCVDNSGLAKPLGTAPLEGCKCPDKKGSSRKRL